MEDSKSKYPSINVLNVVRGIKGSRFRHHITPYRFELPNGEEHRIREIRQAHRERAGQGHHYHFVVKTTEERYFHIVFDTQILTWKMIQEVDEQLFFND